MQQSPYWFPTKLYGWGWGLPAVWQGWVVLGLYFGLLLAAALVYPPEQKKFAFLACTLGLTAALIAICYLKGAPPAWRWGE